jgi:hypothetical protein
MLTGTCWGCADLAQTWFSSFRSGIPLRDTRRRYGLVDSWDCSIPRSGYRDDGWS